MANTKTPAEQVEEARDLVIAYFRQETIDPIKQLGRYLGFGVGGAVLLGLGVFFCAMAGLRALQTETGSTFTGSLSFIPYFIVIVGLLLLAAITWLLRDKKAGE